MEIGFIFVRIPVMLAQLIGGPFDGGVVTVDGKNMLTIPSELGSWEHYYMLVDGKYEYAGRSDGIEKEVNDAATGV